MDTKYNSQAPLSYPKKLHTCSSYAEELSDVDVTTNPKTQGSLECKETLQSGAKRPKI